MTKRSLMLLLVLTPVLAFVVLIAWSLWQSAGSPGPLLVNTVFGEMPVRESAARNFSLQRLDGGEVNLADLKGNVVMIDFWSSWCPPCRAEASLLSNVYGDYKEKNVEFVGVAIWDTPEAARELLDAAGSKYPAGLDEKGVIAIDYGVTGIPEKYFLDRNGQIVRKFVGPMSESTLRNLLDELLE